MASVGDIKTITLPDGNTYDIRDTNAVAMTGATASSTGVSGLVPTPTAGDNTKFLRGDGTWEDGGKPMVILSYGSSTWNDFINAYNSNVIVYCRASSNSNPATGSQTRMAFMAYVNNATTPTEVEFQYYRSVSSHSASQQGDQVFVYKLTSSGTWTVTTREAMAKIVAGTNLSSTYSNNVLTINGDYQAMTGASSLADGETGLVPAPSAGDQDKVLSGAGTWTTIPSVSGKADKVSDATTGNFAGLDANGNLTDSGHKPDDYLEQTYHFVENDTFEKKLWVGFAQFYGNNIWADGANIYYSYSSNQYVLDKSTSTWDTKTWIDLTNFSGSGIWSDGVNIYYSSYIDQKVLDKSTSSWSNKTWTGLTSFLGEEVWSDNTNIYYSFGEDHYILNKSTSTWSEKEWTGLTDFDGENIWTDGANIYYSSGTMQYILDKSTSTWSEKVWTGLTSFRGIDVWTDGNNIYYSNYSNQYVLDTLSATWSSKNWTGIKGFVGAYIWNDGNDIYYSDGSKQYVLVPYDLSNQILLGVTGEWTRTSLNNFKNLIPMTGATDSVAGSSGLVPAPSAGDQNKVLTGSGTWWTAGAPLLTPSTAFNIPSVGTPVIYDMPGITANHELIQWNFSASAENNPPASLSWETYDGYFMITNNAGTTSETIKPVFAQIVSATITQHIEAGE